MDKGVKRDKRSVHIKGRPTLQQAEIIKADIHKYFADGLSASFCMSETGYKQETVYSYFKEWTEELIDKTDFIEQQKAAKVRLVAALDSVIKVYLDQREFLLNKRTGSFNVQLERQIATTNHYLERTHIDKAEVLITPNLDVSIRKLLEDHYGIKLPEKVGEKVQ